MVTIMPDTPVQTDSAAREEPGAALRRLLPDERTVLFRAAMSLTRRRDEAADLVQETCLRALHAERRLELRPFGVRPWLLAILKNVFINHRNRRRRHREVPLDDKDPIPSPAGRGDGIVHDLGPTRPINWDHVDQRLKNAVEALSPKHRDVLLRWALDEWGCARIAAELGIPLGTVMSRLHRARQLVARSLDAPVHAGRGPPRRNFFVFR